MPQELSKRTLLAILAICICIFIASLYNRVITLDDAYFAEQAYWFNKTGYVRTELFNGIFDWGIRQYAYHKLHVWQIAYAIKYIGWSPYIIKSTPIPYLLLLSIASFFYFKRYLSQQDTRPYYIFLSLLFINSYVVQFGFEARPEVMIMSIAFLSFYSIRHGVATENRIFIYISGALAGITTLFHLNGIIFVFSGICVLLYMRKYKYIIIFSLSSAIISSIYWYEMIRNDAIFLGITQLTNFSATLSSDSLSDNHFLKILLSLKRYVRHVFDFSYTFLFFITLYFNKHNIKNNNEIIILLIYLLTSELLLSIISPDGKSMYLILQMPYALMIISSFVKKYPTTIKNTFFLLAITLYAITQAGHSIRIINEGNNEIIQQHEYIFNKYKILKTDRIIAPSIFVFNEIDNANILATEMFKLLEKNNEIIFTEKDVFNYASRHNIRLMILTKDFLANLKNNKASNDNKDYGYRLIGTEFEYYIFEKET